ncbi:MAG: flagellar FliJ family protein [Planctomycetes bacterium]|nr:flagellar FliJ family protein [Planctomycetota bacterium]
MKRFRFRLEKLERLRHHREKLARRELASRIAELSALDDELATVGANLSVCRDDDRHAGSLGVALARGLVAVQRRLNDRRMRLAEQVEAARATYAERRKDYRTLENLHERARAEWSEEVRRAEQQEMDEIARVRFSRDEAERIAEETR